MSVPLNSWAEGSKTIKATIQAFFYQLKQYTTFFDDLLVNVLSYVWSVAAKQQKLFKVLLDTGKSTSLIREGIIPKKDVRKRSQDD